MVESSGISVIVPVTERHDDLSKLFEVYSSSLDATGRPLEFIFVVDGGFAGAANALESLTPDRHELKVITFTRTFGESAALSIGFEHARHDLIMTLPAYQQVAAEDLPKLIDALEEADMVVARRSPRVDAGINQFSGKLFHTLVRAITHTGFTDLGCSVRLIRRAVIDEIEIYGDQHRFLPILVDRLGFKVVEAGARQASSEANLRVYRPGVYLSRLIDLMGVFFVVRFTKKPLRFFGMLGSVLLAGGGLILLVVAAQRLAFDTALSDRPILLLGSLCVVLGLQLFAVGLIGELIIFTHAKDFKEYSVSETVNFHNVDDNVADGGERKAGSTAAIAPTVGSSDRSVETT